MANFMYSDVKRRLGEKLIDWSTDTIKACLIKTGSTAGGAAAMSGYQDVTNLAGFTGAGVMRHWAVGNSTVDADVNKDVTGRTDLVIVGGVTHWYASPTVFPNVPAEALSANVIAVLYYLQTAAAEASRFPLFWIDNFTAFQASGSNITINPNAAGLLSY